MMAAISWWCVNDDAVKYRKSNFPGISGCSFWEPIEKAKWWHKWFTDHIIVDLDKDDA